MFSILDGRETFFQWDLDRKLIVDDESIVEVHFANCLCFNALKCEVYAIDDIHLVDVPNELLTEYMDIRVWGYDGEKTLHEQVFEVKKRAKPEDYIYTPEERETYKQIYRDMAVDMSGDYENSIDIATQPYTEGVGGLYGYIKPYQNDIPSCDNPSPILTYPEMGFYWEDNDNLGTYTITPQEEFVAGTIDFVSNKLTYSHKITRLHPSMLNNVSIQPYNIVKFTWTRVDSGMNSNYDKNALDTTLCNIATYCEEGEIGSQYNVFTINRQYGTVVLYLYCEAETKEEAKEWLETLGEITLAYPMFTHRMTVEEITPHPFQLDSGYLVLSPDAEVEGMDEMPIVFNVSYCANPGSIISDLVYENYNLKDQLTALEERLTALENQFKPIQFTINGKAYEVDNGTVWADFVSDYGETYCGLCGSYRNILDECDGYLAVYEPSDSELNCQSCWETMENNIAEDGSCLACGATAGWFPDGWACKECGGGPKTYVIGSNGEKVKYAARIEQDDYVLEGVE